MRLIALVLTVSWACVVSSYSWAVLPSADASGQPLPTLAPVLERVNPAVVNIATYAKREMNNPLLNDPAFRHFFNIPEQPQEKQRSAGSGVIIDEKAGTVITNYHVIKGADEINVQLTDGRSFDAELVGSDPEVDIAVLKIEAKDLVEVKQSDSDKLRVGDFVVAIGNPFGLGQTVTTGIVSALGRTGLGIGRSMGVEGYEDFIQTDASINPGNSGGALINLRGDLIGINTAIISPAGGNVGIGFAIPINMAMASVQQILEHGEVKRGQIGVTIQDMTPELQEAFDLENGQRGVLVNGVAEGSEAEKAGIKAGDVIIAVDGDETTSVGELRNQIGIHRIGDKVKIKLIREGKVKTLKVKVGDPVGLGGSASQLHELLEGVKFEKNSDGRGVVVAGVARNSVAALSGLRPGDVIMGANRYTVNNMNDFSQALRKTTTKSYLE